MKQIFLDTFYLQALADPQDNAHEFAVMITSELGNFRGVTSEMVLTELPHPSGKGKNQKSKGKSQ